jgi:hypothetical protein
MSARKSQGDVIFQYNRVAITAEKPPDFTDLNDLMEIVLRSGANTPIVVNCQLGRGRSTLASVLLVLIRQWFQWHVPMTPMTGRPLQRSMSMLSASAAGDFKLSKARHSYTVINSKSSLIGLLAILNANDLYLDLLRVLRRGHAIKMAVDEAIDQCSAVYNMRDAIEEARARAEEAVDEKQKRVHAAKGMQNLRRYFELMVFQAYLQSTEPDTMDSLPSVENYVKERPVIKTFEKELVDRNHGLDALKPLERVETKEGAADPDEVTNIVKNRAGAILSASTILKSDFFSNLQKMSLPE